MSRHKRLSREELQALKAIKGRSRLLDAKKVVIAARDPRHPLHHRFTWDDRKAAEEYRIEQARDLIQSAIVIEASRQKYHVYVSLSTSRARGGGYHETSDVLSSEDLRHIMLKDALREIDQLRGRFGMLKELRGVFSAAAAVRAKIESGHKKTSAA